MPELTSSEKEEILRRRHYKSDGDGDTHRASNLDIHHKDRNPKNNDPSNLRVLTRREHQELHSKYG